MRGYQRRVIFLKNTGSALFEEAYFVMRSEEMAVGKSEADMVSEATRIIEENFGKRKSRRKIPTLLTLIFSFLGGALLTFIIALISF
jgi:hypothetical protein